MEILGCCSWKKIKYLPKTIQRYLKSDLSSVQKLDAVMVTVSGGSRKRPPDSDQWQLSWKFALVKTNNIWKRGPYLGPSINSGAFRPIRYM
jgi:hypothetical protein